MEIALIVAPIFALILVGFVATSAGLLPAGAEKGIAVFVFGISVPALLFRTVTTTTLPEVSPIHVWGAYFGAIAVVWLVASVVTAVLLRRPAYDGTTVAMAAGYGNIVMLVIPVCLSAFGPAAASPMALILAVNTPVIWLAGTLQIGWATRSTDTSICGLLASLVKELVRNPIVLGIVSGFIVRFAGVDLHPVVDNVLALLGQAAVPAALVALGASLRGFHIDG